MIGVRRARADDVARDTVPGNRRHRRSFIGGRRTTDRVEAVALGFLAGIIIGAGTWTAHMRRHRRDLFSPHPTRRFAALGFLRGRPSVDSARVLRDYIRWERGPLLRRTAEVALRDMEHFLD